MVDDDDNDGSGDVTGQDSRDSTAHFGAKRELYVEIMVPTKPGVWQNAATSKEGTVLIQENGGAIKVSCRVAKTSKGKQFTLNSIIKTKPEDEGFEASQVRVRVRESPTQPWAELRWDPTRTRSRGRGGGKPGKWSGHPCFDDV
jgi:hypothetical protein